MDQNTVTKIIDPETPFEQAYEELARIVRQLENGDLALEDSLNLYERGQRLMRFCQTRLDSAELRIEQINTAIEEEGEDTT